MSGGSKTPSFDGGFSRLDRLDLGRGAWLDRCPGFLGGHEELFDRLLEASDWRARSRTMYDRVVAVPRLTAHPPVPLPGIVRELSDALSDRYREAMNSVFMALYRDGRDSVAWHGDRHGRSVDNALVATVSLGAPRNFLLRRLEGGGALTLRPGWGDLLVMGGTCQRTWQHCVPKTRRPVGPRIALMFRNAPANDGSV